MTIQGGMDLSGGFVEPDIQSFSHILFSALSDKVWSNDVLKYPRFHFLYSMLKQKGIFYIFQPCFLHFLYRFVLYLYLKENRLPGQTKNYTSLSGYIRMRFL